MRERPRSAPPKRGRPEPERPPSPRRPEGTRGRALRILLPAVLAVVLAFPTFSFTYLYDDYDFLGRSQSFRLSQLLPDPHTLFYRPLSREAYFGLLYLLNPDQPLWG